MSTYEAALLGHLLGVVVLFAGIAVAGAASAAAARRRAPGEVAVLLRLARTGAIGVGAGGLLAPVCGFWLVDLGDFDLGAGWLSAALALYVVAIGLGAAGGQRPKRARLLAERLEAEGVAATPELAALTMDRFALALNAASTACMTAILVLMVVKP